MCSEEPEVISAIIPENVVQFHLSLTEIFLQLSPAVFVLGSSPFLSEDLSFIAMLVTLFFHLKNAQCLVTFFFAVTSSKQNIKQHMVIYYS